MIDQANSRPAGGGPPPTAGGSISLVAGAILAGGLSSRMGQPKAWLPFHGVPLLERVVRRLQQVFREVVVVGAPDQSLPPTGVPVLRDRRSRCGPLGGLEVALGAVSAPAVFVVSCDAPYLQPALARGLVELAGGYDAVVPRWQGRLNPLLAVYSTSVLPVVRKLLEEERLRPVFVLEAVRTRFVEEDEVRALDPAGMSFLNMNHPADYEAALGSAPARVTVELFGEPCVLAGGREITVEVPPPATIRSALQSLARAVPRLVGPVLDPDGDPGSGFLLSVDGREFTQDLLRPVGDGDRLLLLTASAGG